MANSLKTFLLLAALTILIMLVGRALGGQQGMIIAFGLAILMNFGSYWFSDKIVLAMYGAKEIPSQEVPWIHQMVGELASYAGLPKPRIYLVQSDSPNAFATGRNPEHAVVAVTDGILRIMNREELRGVLAHEISHIKNRDILIGSIAATMAGAIMMLANMARFAAFFGGGRSSDEEEGGGAGIIGVIVLSIIAPLAAMLIQMAISRSREYLADATGAQIAGTPMGLAKALGKLSQAVEQTPMEEAKPATAHMFIMNPLSGGGFLSLFSTHPPVEERIRRLETLRF
jgi:heat shock protein HtpX